MGLGNSPAGGKKRDRCAQGTADGGSPPPASLDAALEGVEIPGGLGKKFETLAKVMARLRSPDGCPWDLEQTPETLSRHMLEEAYETVEAIDSEDWDHVSEELGDLLLQIVFHARIAEESGRFDLGDVVDGISEKLERRHPHIFGEDSADTAGQVAANWERIKREKEGKGGRMVMPTGMPAVMASLKVQKHAARDGFDWPDAEGVLSKLDEEVCELEEARNAGDPREVEREIGDVFFTLVNLSRHLGVDPERALRLSASEFAGRYAAMEEEASRSGRDLGTLGLDEQERLWRAAKGRRSGRQRG